MENISAFERSCRGIECAWIGRMRDAVSKRRLLQPEVDEHCPSSTHATLCSRLKESAARVSELDEFHCQQDRVRWFRYPLIFFGLAALTVRFPKSVVELLLNTDNRDLIVKRVPGQPVPTFFGEMAQG
ncbi:hypothetical protein GR223_37645, partial [Rhizobium leguminosarum]|nr:hypothetical protein [Rhizobium ruizarguesonis]